MWISGTFQAIILFSTRKPKQNVCSHYLIKLYVLDLAQRQANCTYNDDVYSTYHSFCILFRLNYICFERIFPMMEFFAINSDFIWRTDNLKQQQRKKHFEIHSKPHDVLCTWKRWSNGIKCTKLHNKNGIANKSLVAIEWSVRTHTHHKAREYVLAMRILCENLASARKKCICQSETLSNQFPIGWWWRDNQHTGEKTLTKPKRET